MVRKIKNVYEFKDYRIFLTRDFMLRSTGNHRYSLRAYSRDLDLSPSFLSDVMSGRKELSPVKGRQIFSRLGFKNDELDYIENLIVVRSSKDAVKKQVAMEYVQSKFIRGPLVSDKDKSLILKSADHFIIHGLVGCTPEHKKILQVCERLNISRQRCQSVLDEMTDAGYFSFKNGCYQSIYVNVNVPEYKDLLATQLQFTRRLFFLINKEKGLNPPYSISNSLAFGLDKNTLPLAHEAYRQLIRTLTLLSNQTPQVERYTFFSSVFYTSPAETACCT